MPPQTRFGRFARRTSAANHADAANQISQTEASEAIIAELGQALAERRVATVKIDTQRKFLEPDYQANRYFRFPEASAAYGRITEALARYGTRFQIPAIEVMFVDPASADLHPGHPGAENIPGADLAAVMPGDLITLETRSRQQAQRADGVPAPATLREFAQSGHPIRLEKNHRNLLKYAERYYGRLTRFAINRFRWAHLKPAVPYIVNEKNARFLRHLKQAGYDTVLLYGVYTDYCVNAALGELQNLGFDVRVIQDAVRPDKLDTIQNPMRRLGRVTLADGTRRHPYAEARYITTEQFLEACKRKSTESFA